MLSLKLLATSGGKEILNKAEICPVFDDELSKLTHTLNSSFYSYAVHGVLSWSESWYRASLMRLT